MLLSLELMFCGVGNVSKSCRETDIGGFEMFGAVTLVCFEGIVKCSML